MMNATKKATERLTAYDDLTDTFLNKYLEETKAEHDGGFGYDELREELYEELESYIDEYEIQMMPFALSQLLAERDHPLKEKDGEEVEKHFEAEGMYEEELSRNGVKNIFLKK